MACRLWLAMDFVLAAADGPTPPDADADAPLGLLPLLLSSLLPHSLSPFLYIISISYLSFLFLSFFISILFFLFFLYTIMLQHLPCRWCVSMFCVLCLVRLPVVS